MHPPNLRRSKMNFWDVHGVWFIIFLCCFPRLTMLATGIFMSWINPLFFLGWMFVPRITVAILATTCYWNTNSTLCVFTWLWAVWGDSSEKKIVVHKRD